MLGDLNWKHGCFPGQVENTMTLNISDNSWTLESLDIPMAPSQEMAAGHWAHTDPLGDGGINPIAPSLGP